MQEHEQQHFPGAQPAPETSVPPQRPVNPSVPPMGNVPPQRPVNPSVPPMGNIPPQRPVNPPVPPMGNMPIHGEFPGNVPPDANKQPEGMNWYQQIPTPGWQTPPPNSSIILPPE